MIFCMEASRVDRNQNKNLKKHIATATAYTKKWQTMLVRKCQFQVLEGKVY